MTLLEKIKSPGFFNKAFKIAMPFFILLLVISLLINNFKQMISFDFAAVAEANFNDGKWKSFFAIKIVFSMLYGMWMAARNTK